MARDIFLEDDSLKKKAGPYLAAVAALAVFGLGMLFLLYQQFVIDVPSEYMAVLTRKTGKDLTNNDEVAPGPDSKGVQKEVLKEGRYFFKYNSYFWEWDVIKQTQIPDGKLGVRIRLHGDDLPYAEFLAKEEHQKGIVPGVLQPGRYYINPYLETVETHDPIVVPAGFKGVVVNLAGPVPTKAEDYWHDPKAPHSKLLLVKEGFRGVQQETLDPGTYFFNPYEKQVKLVDCRNQRFNLGETKDLGFPSKDGFWVSLDSIVEFRINPEKAAEVFALYNEELNGDRVDEEIVRKAILPAARAFCRLQGSNNSGRDFIQGRTQFQETFQTALRTKCDPMGIQIVQGLITKINPPQQIAEPVRKREIAKQQEEQYRQQIEQQKSEQKLAIEKELVKQKQALVQAQQDIVRVTTTAMKEQEVAVTKAKEKKAVGQFKLDAAKDEAAATITRGKGAAEVVEFKNKAEASGWKRSVDAFNGDGNKFAQYVMFQKLSTAYRSIMVNTADSPIMKVFDSFNAPPTTKPGSSVRPAKAAGTNSVAE